MSWNIPAQSTILNYHLLPELIKVVHELGTQRISHGNWVVSPSKHANGRKSYKPTFVIEKILAYSNQRLLNFSNDFRCSSDQNGFFVDDRIFITSSLIFLKQECRINYHKNFCSRHMISKLFLKQSRFQPTVKTARYLVIS